MKPFIKTTLSNKYFIFFIWISVALIASLKGSKVPNNFLIFKGVFFHAIEQVNLFCRYPQEYADMNHYGPIFSLIIAPFTAFPDRIGMLLWNILIVTSLYLAIFYLPIKWNTKLLIFYVPLLELFVTTANAQTNSLVAALIIGSFILIGKKKDFWAACLIALGIFIKLYGIVGLCFFFFSKKKKQFILSLIFWSAIFFVLPMAISSPAFVVQSYFDWYESLVAKNIQNITQFAQDISAIGLIRRVFGLLDISALYIIVPGIILFALQYVNTKKYTNLVFQLGILASALLFVILFSTGSESPTYIIAIIGICIWFCIQEQPYNKWILIFFIIAAVWTSFATSYILPRDFRVDVVRRYSLKAIPSLMVWLLLVYQLISFRGLTKTVEENEEEKNINNSL